MSDGEDGPTPKQVTEDLLAQLCGLGILDGEPEEYTVEAPSRWMPNPEEFPPEMRDEYEAKIAQLEGMIDVEADDG